MKKCAVINDLSGFGKCSLSVAIPIISVMGSEVHPMPCAVLSNQTAYDTYEIESLTGAMPRFISQWKKLDVQFDAIMTGFVSEEKQLDIINDFVDTFKGDNTIVLVDPVMADNGALYNGYTPSMCLKIKELCKKADIITPNVAELAVLADKPYSTNLDDIKSYAALLQSDGSSKIVVTGYKENDTISNLAFDGDIFEMSPSRLCGGYYSGTGDITASVIMGGVLRGMSLADATCLASAFTEKSILATKSTNANDGVDFERFLGDLL